MSANPETLQFLNEVNGVANDAEVGAFNPAIEAATGEKADALQVSSGLLEKSNSSEYTTLTKSQNSVARSRTRSLSLRPPYWASRLNRLRVRTSRPS